MLLEALLPDVHEPLQGQLLPRGFDLRADGLHLHSPEGFTGDRRGSAAAFARGDRVPRGAGRVGLVGATRHVGLGATSQERGAWGGTKVNGLEVGRFNPNSSTKQFKCTSIFSKQLFSSIACAFGTAPLNAPGAIPRRPRRSTSTGSPPRRAPRARGPRPRRPSPADPRCSRTPHPKRERGALGRYGRSVWSA